MKKELLAIILNIYMIVVAVFDLAYLVFLGLLINFLVGGNAVLLPFLWTTTIIVIVLNTLLLCFIAVYLVFRKQ